MEELHKTPDPFNAQFNSITFKLHFDSSQEKNKNKNENPFKEIYFSFEGENLYAK